MIVTRPYNNELEGDTLVKLAIQLFGVDLVKAMILKGKQINEKETI